MLPLVNIFWFRRDLRLHDNAALFQALQSGRPVVPVFIFDPEILDRLEDRQDRRVEFIHAALGEIQAELAGVGASLEVFHGTVPGVFSNLLGRYSVDRVFANHDYEPYARTRDAGIHKLLLSSGAALVTCKDQVIFEKGEVVKEDGRPYTVFTPYSKKWKSQLQAPMLKRYPTRELFDRFYRQPARPLPSLADIGFQAVDKPFPSRQLREDIIRKYDRQRDFPALEGTSKMGVHLRFGTVSIRELAERALALNAVYLNELIWRDFYHAILWHFPQVGEGKSFKPEYDWIKWRNNEEEFERWCRGNTGYPIVDAGMRELNETGYMHNRVRMVVASFLTKHLLIDWRWGEAYFARKLLDFDLAANNGGWQWAAGSGCDAAPYFRIFNPYLQTQKFDAGLNYIRKWVPELETFAYPGPMVDHDLARKRALEVYGAALRK